MLSYVKLSVFEVIISVVYTTYAELHSAPRHIERDPDFILASARVDKKIFKQNVR